ncbi:hypothetical protein GCM10010435_44190 [Winogradskya consettensis]|uniref:Uncharacterized protein n=1 Tax=Winogradskya consettensis TaxID=113560 RepID=A0A919VZU9_9ACTN|nr:hypothetical protein [Actinoplanes consettensis]GIM82650.1 hypothetical protein Aco04nite_82580 [Actinoplanes consettensis]
MTIKVTISEGDREVSIEATGNPPVAAVVADALTAWARIRPRRRAQERPRLEAGGIGFCAELGPDAG